MQVTRIARFIADCGQESVPHSMTFAGVYRITPDLGTISLLVSDFVLPNGLAFTPDEKGLYINDSRR